MVPVSTNQTYMQQEIWRFPKLGDPQKTTGKLLGMPFQTTLAQYVSFFEPNSDQHIDWTLEEPMISVTWIKLENLRSWGETFEKYYRCRHLRNMTYVDI
jgi:hypothetical protein